MTLRLIPASEIEQHRNREAEELLAGLNAQQHQAVTTVNGPLLIIAGAGSGKTRVLTVRIAHLLQTGTAPSQILALTFTNKAAQEMKERIEHLVGGGVARNLWAGTFHSIFARILRSHADLIGYTSTFTIYDAEDQLSAIKAAMATIGISQQVLSATSVRARISSAKNAMLGWRDMDNTAASVTERQTAQIYQEYERRLLQSNAMDFDDLLLNTIVLLRSHPDVLDKYQERFRHILVDEYQDTNRAQYHVITMLARKYRNLCVVGDDAQSIYRWRGAEIRNILDFERDYHDATVVRLEQNYRSTKVILAAADGVIANNAGQIRKTLWTENPDGEKITLMSCRDDREEASVIASLIRQRVRDYDFQYRDVAILYRTNAQSQALEDALRRENMPYHIVSGVSFYKRKEVKDTIAYLRLLVNPHDTESLLRVINEPARGIGTTSLQRIQEFAQAQACSLYTAMESVSEIPGLQRRTQASVEEFIRLVQTYRDLMNQEPPAAIAQAYIEASGLPNMYQQQHTEEALDRWNNIERVLSHIAEQQSLNPELTLTTYLEQVSLVSDQDDPELGNNKVALMTMHAAKGLEFALVVIAGMEQGLFPLQKAETDQAEQEEERRLFYVGLTRAREQLILTHAERRFRFGEIGFSRPSMFLNEIPEECIHVEGAGRGMHTPLRGSKPAIGRSERTDDATFSNPYSQLPMHDLPASIPRKGVSSRPAVATHQYRTGMKVKHPLFGVGHIENLSGTGQQAKATVLFTNGQRKQLMLAFAKLEIV